MLKKSFLNQKMVYNIFFKKSIAFLFFFTKNCSHICFPNQPKPTQGLSPEKQFINL